MNSLSIMLRILAFSLSISITPASGLMADTYQEVIR